VIEAALDGPRLLPAGVILNPYHVGGLEAFRTFGQIEFDRFALVQAPVPALLDGRKMYEHVLTGGPLNESVSFGPVKPLYCTFLSHKLLLSPLNS
jgi:hypothetical protein